MRAYERLLRYVKIHTTSDEASGKHPSFEGEFELAAILEKELKELGLADAHTDEHCYVYGSLPASEGFEDAVPIGFIAHMDTSDEASGRGVDPIIHENYDGLDVVLPGSGDVLDVRRFPFLKLFKGETLITSDGTTLLGADDKAGIAEIMTALELIRDGHLPHGPIRIAFTPDEEIGEGADLFDVKGFGAKYAYTVDGGDIDCLEYENFNAAAAKITVKGTSVHPGSAKNMMVNAQNVAMEFHSMLPVSERPEYTEGHEGFYHLTEFKGHVSSAELSYIIRDHLHTAFEKRKEFMSGIAEYLNSKYGEGTVTLTLRDQYYNMLEKIMPEMHLINNARRAIESLGITAHDEPVRGGTDGARLSFEGLPCPNLGTGGYNFHGPYECITAERMDRATQIILYLIDVYKSYK